MPGTYMGPFSIGKITLGLEICLDHSFLSRRLTPEGKKNPPLIHVVISAAVASHTSRRKELRDGGFFVHASSQMHHCTVEQRVDGKMTKIKPRVELGVARLGVWDVTYASDWQTSVKVAKPKSGGMPIFEAPKKAEP